MSLVTVIHLVNKSEKVTYFHQKQKNHAYQNKKHCFLKLQILSDLFLDP